MTAKKSLTGRTWTTLLIFGLFGQIAWVIENMYFNLFLYNTITGDTRMIAAMVAASAVTATVTTLLMGALSDKVGKRKAFIVGGYILWGLSIIAFAFVSIQSVSTLVPIAAAAHTAALLVIVLDCIMTFFGSTANDAAFNAWVTDVTSKENRGRVESVLAAMPLLAMLIVFGFLDPLSLAGRWNVFFFIVGGTVIAGGLIGGLLIKESPHLARGEGSYFKNIIYGLRPSIMRTHRELYLVFTALAIYSISFEIFMPYLIIYIQRFLGMDNYAMVMGAVLIMSAVISMVCGRWIDKFGKLPFSIVAGIFEMAGLVLMFFARGTWQVIASGTVMMGGNLLVMACFGALIRDYTPEGKAGQLQGIRILFWVMLPMVIGPYIGSAVIRGSGLTYEELGVVKEVPSPEMFLAAAGVLLLIAIPIALLWKRTKRNPL
jgi:MFS family permease